MEEGIGGMVHISDLSWTKRFSHPSEFTKVGNPIDVVILEIDKENRKLSLGHKQIEENPWDTFESVFPVGSYHEATVIRRDDRGVIVQLPYGLEAFAPIKHMKKEDGKLANVDETMTVKVIEFNRDDKRILVSHLRYLEDIRREADESVKKEKDVERQTTRKAVRGQQSKVERTTLGDMAAFSELAEQLKDEPVKAKAKPAKEVPAAKTEEVKAEEAPAKVEEAKVETEEAPVEKAKTTKKEATTGSGGDNLKVIEGVGPKIEEILHNGGLKSYSQVSDATPEAIREILEAAGSRYKMHDPTTWPEQAKLAAAGNFDKLKEWQDSLQGGKK